MRKTILLISSHDHAYIPRPSPVVPLVPVPIVIGRPVTNSATCHSIIGRVFDVFDYQSMAPLFSPSSTVPSSGLSG